MCSTGCTLSTRWRVVRRPGPRPPNAISNHDYPPQCPLLTQDVGFQRFPDRASARYQPVTRWGHPIDVAVARKRIKPSKWLRICELARWRRNVRFETTTQNCLSVAGGQGSGDSVGGARDSSARGGIVPSRRRPKGQRHWPTLGAVHPPPFPKRDSHRGGVRSLPLRQVAPHKIWPNRFLSGSPGARSRPHREGIKALNPGGPGKAPVRLPLKNLKIATLAIWSKRG